MGDKSTPTPWEDIDGDVIVGPETDIVNSHAILAKVKDEGHV